MLDLTTPHSQMFLHTPVTIPKRGLVLIADDQPEFRMLYRRILGLDGWDVVEANDGREALRLVLERVPDVLVLDHWMPELNGDEVVRKLRTLDYNIPTVLISSASDIADMALKLGVERYVAKPFKPKELKDAVQFAQSLQKLSPF